MNPHLQGNPVADKGNDEGISLKKIALHMHSLKCLKVGVFLRVVKRNKSIKIITYTGPLNFSMLIRTIWTPRNLYIKEYIIGAKKPI